MGAMDGFFLDYDVARPRSVSAFAVKRAGRLYFFGFKPDADCAQSGYTPLGFKGAPNLLSRKRRRLADRPRACTKSELKTISQSAPRHALILHLALSGLRLQAYHRAARSPSLFVLATTSSRLGTVMSCGNIHPIRYGNGD